MPRNGLVLSRGDLYINTLRYLQECEGIRPDIRLIDLEQLKTQWMRELVKKHYPEVRLPPGLYRPEPRPEDNRFYSLLDIFDLNFGLSPLYINRIKKHSKLRWGDRYQAIPQGLIYRVVRSDSQFEVEPYFEESDAGFGSLNFSSFPDGIRPGSWEDKVRLAYCRAQDARAERLVEYGRKSANYTRMLIKSRQIVKEIIRLDPERPPSYYKNLGIICFRLRSSDPQAEAEMIVAWQHYVKVAPQDDPQLPDIRRELHRALQGRSAKGRP
jgi:hypothetical protein